MSYAGSNCKCKTSSQDSWEDYNCDDSTIIWKNEVSSLCPFSNSVSHYIYILRLVQCTLNFLLHIKTPLRKNSQTKKSLLFYHQLDLKVLPKNVQTKTFPWKSENGVLHPHKSIYITSMDHIRKGFMVLPYRKCFLNH